MADRIEKLSLNELKPNMILAEDALNVRGLNILSKNTRLTVDSFERLRRNKVKNVVVWSSTIEPATEPFIESMRTSIKPPVAENPITQSEEFIKFTEEYERKLTAFKNCLAIIKSGHYMDTNTLYSIVDGIVSIAACKSDLLTYVCYLNELDDYTYTHSINVSILCNIVSKWLNFNDEEVKKISIAGLLHDIGKNMLEQSVIDHELSPTDAEAAQIRLHPEYSCRMLEKLKMDESVMSAIYMHHERIDGSGYPQGLKDEKISNYAKVLAICDVYDNLITKKRLTPFKALQDFETTYITLLDTEYMMKFVKNILYIYTGSWAKLSDGRACQIVFINNNYADRPIVKVNNEIVDLVKKRELYIESMI